MCSVLYTGVKAVRAGSKCTGKSVVGRVMSTVSGTLSPPQGRHGQDLEVSAGLIVELIVRDVCSISRWSTENDENVRLLSARTLISLEDMSEAASERHASREENRSQSIIKRGR